jgi:FkbM family methyltransferase
LILKDKIKKYLSLFFIYIKKIFKIEQKNYYENFFIRLPATHRLPIYQLIHPKYDRFLPHLVKYITGNKVVVDVGANCGDTLAGLVEKNQNLHFLCIEPDQYFYDLMQKNIELIKVKYPSVKIATVKSLVGKSFSNISLVGEGSTKHAVVGDGQLKTKSLDDILMEVSLPPVALLKTDVDGFDFDVIDSSRGLLNEQQPMIFFECQIDFEYQKKGFETTISDLKYLGYVNWTIFDNFGEMILRTADIEQIHYLIKYAWQQQNMQTTRTIYYYDILACGQNDVALIDNVLADYSLKASKVANENSI